MDLTPERPPAPLDPNRDAGKLIPADYPMMELSPALKGRKNGFQVIFRRAAINAIHAHGATSLQNEICGVVVGQIHQDKRGAYLYIAAAIAGEHASHHAAQVTFTSETWTAIHKVMDADYPDLRIVGWYHTHPGFGIFLSGMDLFIHDHFFDLPWQIALVYDPISKDEGSFVWRAGQPKREPFLIHEAPGPWITPSSAASATTGQPNGNGTIASQITDNAQSAAAAPSTASATTDQPTADPGSSNLVSANRLSDASAADPAANGACHGNSTASSPISLDLSSSAISAGATASVDVPQAAESHASAATDTSLAQSAADPSAPPPADGSQATPKTVVTLAPVSHYWQLPPLRALRLFTRDLFRRQFRGSQNR